MIGKYCYTTAAVKIESIFIGNKISLQVKLYEAVIEPVQQGGNRLLPRPAAQSVVLQASRNEGTVSAASVMDDDDDDDDDGSIEDEQVVPTPAAPRKKVVIKRSVKKT